MRRVVLIGAAALLLAACGGGGGGNSQAAQVTKLWQDFFSSKVAVSKKPAMVQNGSQVTATINAIAQNPLASNTSAKVSKVTLQGSDKATVVYSIYLGNTPVLKNESGQALKQSGKWVIADSSLCGLLKKEGGSLPSVCSK